MDYIIRQIQDSIEAKKRILKNNILLEKIDSAISVIVASYKNNGKILLAGNGGSSSDAQHLAGELVNRFYINRPGLPAIALTSDSAVITAIANDYSYDVIFSKQLQALGSSGDVFIGISTSGNSKNIINCFEICKKKNIYSIGFTGDTGGLMEQECDLCITVPSAITPRIQESHIMIGHIICQRVEELLFS